MPFFQYPCSHVVIIIKAGRKNHYSVPHKECIGNGHRLKRL